MMIVLCIGYRPYPMWGLWTQVNISLSKQTLFLYRLIIIKSVVSNQTHNNRVCNQTRFRPMRSDAMNILSNQE